MKGLDYLSLIFLFTLGCASQNPTAEGMRFYGQSQYDSALTAFQSALKANPNDPNSLYNIAATYHQSARVSLQLGSAAAAQQQYEQASQFYQLCLASDSNHAAAHRGLSALYMECQNGKAAYDLLIDWYNRNPVSVEPKLELARHYHEFVQICLAQGRPDDATACRSAAETYLQQVLQSEPGNNRALRALGFLKEQSGDIAGAVFEYQRALQANPQQRDLEERIAALTK